MIVSSVNPSEKNYNAFKRTIPPLFFNLIICAFHTLTHKKNYFYSKIFVLVNHVISLRCQIPGLVLSTGALIEECMIHTYVNLW